MSSGARMDSLNQWDTAKYGVYTMFCSSISKIVHFELIQVSVNSKYMATCIASMTVAGQ